MPLWERTYDCKRCNLSIDRDVDAAINIFNMVIKGHSRIYASGDAVTTVERSAAKGVDESETICRKRPVGNPRF